MNMESVYNIMEQNNFGVVIKGSTIYPSLPKPALQQKSLPFLSLRLFPLGLAGRGVAYISLQEVRGGAHSQPAKNILGLFYILGS
jgi:hypothetical protein